MNDSKAGSGRWAAEMEKNTIVLGAWTLAWVLTMAVAVFGPRLIWGSNGTLSLIAILLNLAVGFGMIMANIRHLKGLDEMQQRIQLEAMGLSLGVGLVVGLAYSNLDVVKFITFDAQISHLVILMGLTYATAVFAGLRRYR
ncbi:MAG TPA: hypothetical protein VIS57_01550 [Xanthomonadales bacterium]